MMPAKRKAQPEPGRRVGPERLSHNGRSAGQIRVSGATAVDRIAVQAGRRDS